MRSEASFAALAGTSPVEASSGKQRRHRLNRGGDRQLNWALHVVALQRIRHHRQPPPTTSGSSLRARPPEKHVACVKRSLARHFYRCPAGDLEAALDNIEASGFRPLGGSIPHG
jgi:transposase